MEDITLPPIPDLEEIFRSLLAFLPNFSELHPFIQFALHSIDEALLVLACYWIVRFFTISTQRWLGLYSPSQYHYWPRLPWRWFYRTFWLAPKSWYEKLFLIGKRGHTGGFAGLLETLTYLYRPGMLYLGRATLFGLWSLPQAIGSHLEKHCFCVASSGSGKSTHAITMLSEWAHSAFLIDPDASISERLAIDDKRNWVILDPYNISGFESAHFNVFDCLVAASKRTSGPGVVVWAERIANALVILPSGAKQPYFYEVARDFLKALILHVFSNYDESYWNLPTVRRLIVEGIRYCEDEDEKIVEIPKKERSEMLLFSMSENTNYGTAIQGGVAALEQAAGETAGNVWSTLSNATGWLDNPQVAKILTKTTLPLEELQTKKDKVLSFVAPLQSIRDGLAPLAKLLTDMIYDTFSMTLDHSKPCLMLVDEVPSQGFNNTFITIFAAGRKHGLLFFGIAQNLGQMIRIYQDEWETFLSEVDFVMYMGIGHMKTSDHIAKFLGEKTVLEKKNRTKTYRTVDVMDSDQVRRYLDAKNGNIILTRPGKRPLRLSIDKYFKGLSVRRYSPDPAYGDAFPRNITRKLFGRKANKES
ncbi:type IV secretory system conjugative DNA transfer family protein [Porticoccus sp. W117]|uniref:type IV secretory system conjugative DNA transfer family protein n=1 Tax=Porticoccus sp. W117 TaxID=3054777 RepID=UPI002593C680|nr:type IV secretory system conjugative DNA transfer family protein [Porticoccus sp. W117]MDM3871806.1 type IV secretory system conjugative DNA transfer family protein [Porticoccus sp. W117]